MRILRTLASVLLLIAVLGCHGHRYEAVGPEHIEPALSERLNDGRTTRDEILAMFGTPSGRFEDGRILTYRMDRNHEVVVPAAATGARQSLWEAGIYSLVLIFNDDAILERHRLIRVR